MGTPDVVTRELAVLGAAFGAPSWAQGPGGNVSVKHEGRLYVKASGTRLTTVANEGGHVGVALADALAALDGDRHADARVFAETPRPSLETYFHAIGGAVVAHTHAVGVLLAACAKRGAPEIPVVPYERPGRGLALAVRRVRDGAKDARAIMLQSHGLLVDAATAEAAVAISRETNARCLAAFDADVASFDALLASYRASPVVEVAGGFARQLPRRAHGDRYLFPDAVVYASVVRASTAKADALPAAVAAIGRAVVVVDDANERAAFAKSKGALDSCVEVLAAHDWVEDVLAKAGVARYLADDEPAKILDLPSEKYRMKLE